VLESTEEPPDCSGVGGDDDNVECCSEPPAAGVRTSLGGVDWILADAGSETVTKAVRSTLRVVVLVPSRDDSVSRS